MTNSSIYAAFERMWQHIVALVGTRVDSHASNTSNPHSVTKAQVGLGNVENKSSATILSEMTKENVISALGCEPSAVIIRTWSNADLEV